MYRPHEIQLTGRASRFVFMLRDFGHIDDDGVDRLLLGASELRPTGDRIDLEDVRRAAAMMLFPDDGELPAGLLRADWPILFS